VRRPQAGDAAAFLIHHEHGVPWQHLPQRRHQAGKLPPVLDVASEQDDPGRRMGPKQRRFAGQQLRSGKSDDGGFHVRSGAGSVGRYNVMAGFCASH